MAVATALRAIAGVVRFLGLVRWPFLVPYLADTYLAPASIGATREAVAVVFQAFNQYAGVAVGENPGYLFTGPWTVLVALAMFGSPLPLRRWLGLLGMVSAASVLVGTLEPAGFEPAANVVVIGYILWSIWPALFGLCLLLPRFARVAGWIASCNSDETPCDHAQSFVRIIHTKTLRASSDGCPPQRGSPRPRSVRPPKRAPATRPRERVLLARGPA